jgi:hypothetical protein
MKQKNQYTENKVRSRDIYKSRLKDPKKWTFKALGDKYGVSSG